MNYAIILSGGIGTRMQMGDFPKQYLEVEKKPILLYTLEQFQKSSAVEKIVIVAADAWRDEDLDEDEIAEYISEHFEGNCLIAVGDEDLIKIHFHTNEPWKILEYCNSIGEIYDIVVEDMIRQSAGLKG